MTRRSLVPVLALLLLTTPLLASAQGPGDGGAPDDAGAPEDAGPGFDPRERAAAADRDWENLSAEKRERAGQIAEQARLFALFQIDEAGAVTGRFVTFALDAGAIDDYTVVVGENGTTFFDRVETAPLNNVAEPVLAGATLRVFADEALLAVQNNPTAQLRVAALDNVTVTFDLAEGVSIASVEEGAIRLNAGERHGHLVLSGEGSFANTTDGVTATLGPDASVAFLAHPQAETVHAAALHAQIAAIAEERLGGEISVVAVDDEPVSIATEYDVALRPTSVAAGRVVIEASSEVEGGRAVLVNVPTDLLEDATAERLVVLLDGEPLERGTSIDALLQTPVGAEGAYQVAFVEGAAQVAVTIPSFSTHEITIASAEEDPATDTTDDTTDDGAADGAAGADGGAVEGDDTPAPGLVLALATLALAALVLRRRA